jgi:fructose-bisphosphate aldolase class 1
VTELVTTALALVADGKGILAVESIGTMDKRLTAVGVAATAWCCPARITRAGGM